MKSKREKSIKHFNDVLEGQGEEREKEHLG